VLKEPVLGQFAARGWATVDCPDLSSSELASTSSALCAYLVDSQKAEPRPTQVLTPTSLSTARRGTLSAIFGTGEFPLHVDGAHLVSPPKIVILACVEIDSPPTGSYVLPFAKAAATIESVKLSSIPFLFASGRGSFYSTITSSQRQFIRFDPGCMRPTSSDGQDVIDEITSAKLRAHAELIEWRAGRLLILDNHRVLHGRATVRGTGTRRILRATSDDKSASSAKQRRLTW
jgi:alpha-ketoglutarate-dependent taurine dioxygenase